jgi:hypothetical protein
MTQQKSKLAVKHMTSFAAVAGLVLALAPAAQAVTIITDDVESLADYTISTSGWFDFVNADPFRGLSPVAGDFIMAGYSTPLNGASTGTFTLTAGFGAGNLIQAGTYAFTISVGDTDWIDRASFEYFDHRLQTTAGATELPNPVVTKPYVQPPIGDIKPGAEEPYTLHGDGIAEWTTTIITYTVPAGHALIGEQFTWAASFGHGVITEDYAAAGFDAVRIEFTPDSASDPEITDVRHLGTTVELDLEDLDSAKTYKLFRDTVLPLSGSKVPIGPDITGTTATTVTDSSSLPVDAYYQVEQQP